MVRRRGEPSGRLASLALGSHTAGSVRIPACMTGNVGLKVTIGCWSTEGLVRDLGFTATVFGWGAGIFFFG
jgi:Asp-tRNA(Asn)/Glu-tRNA(Gln) amidotransferase A subunit family amidase